MTGSYPWYTPYQFAGNKPINSIDLDGLEEFESYKAYKYYFKEDALVKMDGSDGAWLTSDRENRNETWSNAMATITKNEWQDRFTSFSYDELYMGVDGGIIDRFAESYKFSIIRDYYNWAQHEIDENGFSSEWAKGASYLVDELNNSVASMILTGIYPLFKDLNLGIAQYAIIRFNAKLYGNEPRDGYEFDENFIAHEQVLTVAPAVYSKYSGTYTLWAANNLARKEFPFGSGARVFGNHFFPSFATFGVSINNEFDGFGAQGRYDIPLLMLYKDIHPYEMNEAQKAEIDKANQEINNYYQTKMKY